MNFAYIRRRKQLAIKTQDKIAGIHNYCDRWCERCAMTARCTLFVADEQRVLPDLSGKAAALNFEKALEQFHLWVSENKITLEQLIPDSEAENKRREKNKTNPRTSETSRLANEYRVMWSDFRFKNKPVFERFNQHTTGRAELQMKANLEAVDLFQYAVDTIDNYEQHLPVRISCAYISSAEKRETVSDPVQNEFNGNAKVVLLVVEDSFAAWEILLKLFPEVAGQCRTFQMQLDRIRKRILIDFPNAPFFIRPGFDEKNLTKSSY
ncbi:MAG: hypothetical protein HYZ14_08530 [Bacteroidetes bacterium]|nr:hypothetical protein [Bacteroidota bacterium]